MTHTPTPWHSGSTETTELVMGFRNDIECVIAELSGEIDIGQAEVEADRDFILKAVNNHDALVKAIRDIKQATIEGRVCDDVAWFDQIETLHDFCDRILSVVGSQSND
jgi:hypothetical protein